MTCRPLRILLIDDCAAILRGVRRLLGAFDVVECATSAHGGLALLAQHRVFDVIVCDLNMPGMSGLELIATLAASRPELAPAVVLMTGDPDAVPRSTANIVLAKPFSGSELRDAIARAAGISDAPQAA